MRHHTIFVLIGCSSIGLAACGDDGDRAGATTPAGAGTGTTATSVATPPPAATAAPTATATPGPTGPAGAGTTGPAGTTTTEIGPAPGEEEGPGDDEAARTPADFRVGAGLEPSRITVAAFLTVELAATSTDGRAHTLRLTTPAGPVTLNVPAGGRATVDVPGMPEGEYAITLDGRSGAGTLVVGGEPGP